MAGDEDSQRISPYGPACCLKGARFINSLCDVLVGNGLAVGDFCDLRPNCLLEAGSVEGIRHGKHCALTGKVFLQLAIDFRAKGRRLIWLVLFGYNTDKDNFSISSADFQQVEGAFVKGVGSHKMVLSIENLTNQYKSIII